MMHRVITVSLVPSFEGGILHVDKFTIAESTRKIFDMLVAPGAYRVLASYCSEIDGIASIEAWCDDACLPANKHTFTTIQREEE